MDSYVDRVLSRLEGVTPGPDGWTALCPCPLHSGGSGDHNPSLRVTVGDGGRLLVRCRAGCDTAPVLEAAGLRFTDLWPGPGDTPAEPMASEPEAPTEAELDFRHEVYSALLARLKLKPDHRANLRGRGLGDAAIDAGGYRSLAGPADLAPLWRKYGDSAFSVPGFRPRGRGVGLAASGPGILVPCRDAKGRVNALKLRRDDPRDGPRYQYLSGGGASCGAVLHHPLGSAPDGVVRVTEGELKADVCVAVTGVFTLGVPGVGLASRVLPWLAQPAFGDRKPEVVLAFDWPDMRSKPQVAEAVLEAGRLLSEAGYATSVETWDDRLEHKGIDDLLAAGHRPRAVPYGEVHGLLGRPGTPGAGTPARSAPKPWERAPEAFPASCLPAPFGDFVAEVGRVKGAPVDFPGCVFLTLAGAAVGTARRLRVDQDWHEFPCLYCCVLAPPSRKKTPVLRTFMQPLYDRQREEQALADADPDHPMRHYFMSDITVEGAVKQLRRHPRGLLYVKDELVGWVSSANQYRNGRGEDRQFWLSTWSSSPYKKDRQNSDSVYIHHPFLAVVGNTTPDQAREFADPKGRQDGFLQRILMVYPEWSERTRLGRPSVDDSAYRGLLDRLYALEHDAEGAPVTLGFDPAAFRAYESWYDALQDEVDSGDFHPELAGFWNKLPAYCARLALILRLVETDDPQGAEPVRVADVERAAELCRYFGSHYRQSLGLLDCRPDDRLLPRLCEACLAQPSGLITAREAMRRLRLPTKSAARDLFKRAADLGLGDAVLHTHPASGRKAEAFRHPSVEA